MRGIDEDGTLDDDGRGRYQSGHRGGKLVWREMMDDDDESTKRTTRHRLKKGGLAELGTVWLGQVTWDAVSSKQKP
jgi:hypothetical protein